MFADQFGNRTVILPTLGSRGLGTSVAQVAPEALSDEGAQREQRGAG